MAFYDNSVILLGNASATGAAIPLHAGRWCFAVDGTFGGATVSLEILGPDGTNYLSVGEHAELTAQGAVEVALPDSVVRAVVTGGTPSALYATLSRIGS